KDFAYISKKLNEISLAIDSLNLWVDKTAGEQGLNLELLNAEKAKLK
ncbi:XRE family transcriptional regulator, partial [Blautia wexlerae]